MRIGTVIGVVLLAGSGFYMWDLVQKSEPAPAVPKEFYEEPEHAEATLTLSSDAVAQGEVLVVEAEGSVTNLRMGEERITLANLGLPGDNRTVAVIGFDTRAPLGTRTLTYDTSTGTKTTTFRVVKRAYPVTQIVVPEKLAEEGVTSGDLVKSIEATDNVTLSDIVDVETARYHITGQFVEPTDTWVDVGEFGNVRSDQYGSIRHLGVDLEGVIGDPVYAINGGVVVFAGELQNYGNSIVIDHGVGIFSIYLHLSVIETSTNVQVSAGERIAQIGNTGAYTLAPHLHFSIKVHTVSVDPRTFIDTFNEAL